MQIILLEGRGFSVVSATSSRSGRLRPQLPHPARQGQARDAANLAEFEARPCRARACPAEKLAAAQELRPAARRRQRRSVRKAGMDGRLFSSVATPTSPRRSPLKGFDIERSAIRMPDGRSRVGETSLEVSLHADVLANITVVVVGPSSNRGFACVMKGLPLAAFFFSAARGALPSPTSPVRLGLRPGPYGASDEFRVFPFLRFLRRPELANLQIKLPPHSLEAEQSLIGGILLDNQGLGTRRRPGERRPISIATTTVASTATSPS